VDRSLVKKKDILRQGEIPYGRKFLSGHWHAG